MMTQYLLMSASIQKLTEAKDIPNILLVAMFYKKKSQNKLDPFRGI